jgi:hypothetical protein
MPLWVKGDRREPKTRAENVRVCPDSCRITVLRRTTEFPLPQPSGYVVTGRFEEEGKYGQADVKVGAHSKNR